MRNICSIPLPITKPNTHLLLDKSPPCSPLSHHKRLLISIFVCVIMFYIVWNPKVMLSYGTLGVFGSLRQWDDLVDLQCFGF